MYELAESEVNYISHGPEEEQLPGLGELKTKLEQIISYCKESQRFVLVCKTFFYLLPNMADLIIYVTDV